MKRLPAKDYFTEVRDFVCLLLHLTPENGRNPHCHEYYEIELIIRGRAADEINGTSISLHSGDFLLLGPEDYHQIHAVDRQGFELVNLAFSKAVMQKILGFLELTEEQLFSSRPIGHFPAEETTLICAAARELAAPPGDAMEEQRLLKELIVTFLLHSRKGNEAALVEKAPGWLQELLLQMKTPAGMNGGIAYLKKLAPVSYPHLCRCFQKHCGKAPVEWINEQRILRAGTLLLNTNLSVLEISLECGFQNLSHFNHLFKGAYGLPPTAYRKFRKNTALFSE